MLLMSDNDENASQQQHKIRSFKYFTSYQQTVLSLPLSAAAASHDINIWNFNFLSLFIPLNDSLSCDARDKKNCQSVMDLRVSFLYLSLSFYYTYFFDLLIS